MSQSGLSSLHAILTRTQHGREYTKRRRARKAAQQPWKHCLTVLRGAAHRLSCHHGSKPPKTLIEAIASRMPSKLVCQCGWNVYGKTSIKRSKERGNCGAAWCEHAVAANTVVKAAAGAVDATAPKPSKLAPKDKAVDTKAAEIEAEAQDSESDVTYESSDDENAMAEN